MTEPTEQPLLRLEPEQSLLAIGAHYDDIELGCGGVLALAARRGCPVTMLVLTNSAYVHATDGQERGAELAAEEGRRAAEALGVHDVRCAGLANMYLRWDAEMVGKIEAVINEVQPSIIFTHWAFDTHQDHHHGSMATLSAARYFPTILMYDPIFPSGRSYHPFRPQLYFDIGEALDAKLAALREHRSQHDKYGSQWVDAVRARAQYRGYEIGVGFAEAFEVVRMRVSL